MWRKRLSIFFLCLVFVSLFTVVGKTKEKKEIVIPTVDEVRNIGYPKNTQGETFGPDIWESVEEPDLVLVCNEFGQEGYVRQSDFDSGVNSPEEAKNYQPKQYYVNMYLNDGYTIVGRFKIQK